MSEKRRPPLTGRSPAVGGSVDGELREARRAGGNAVLGEAHHHGAVLPEDAKKFQAADEKKLAAAKDGTANRAWVEKSLAEKGYEIIDSVYPG